MNTTNKNIPNNQPRQPGSFGRLRAACACCYQRVLRRLAAADDPGCAEAPDGGRHSTSTVQIGTVQTSYTGLVATYYSDVNLMTPVVSQIESNIDYVWGSQWGNEVSPAPGVGVDRWSAKWEGGSGNSIHG